MAEVDMEALSTVNKVFAIIFSVAIILVNAGLIVKIVPRQCSNFKFMYDQKKLTLISLAVGDIFLAVCDIVVLAVAWFGSKDELSCREYYPSVVYSTYFLPYVYATSLVALAVDLICRLKRTFQMSNNVGQSVIPPLIISAAPWFLGLNVVFPLTMWGMDWDTCKIDYSTARLKSMSIVSICIPASVALLAAMCAMCVKQNEGTYYRPLFRPVLQHFIVQFHCGPSTKQMQVEPLLAKFSDQYLRAQNSYFAQTYLCKHMPQYSAQMYPLQQAKYPRSIGITQPPAPTNEPKVPTNQTLVPTNQPPAPTNQPKVLSNQTLVPTNQPPAPTNQPQVPTFQPSAPTNKLQTLTYRPPAPTHQPSANSPQPLVTKTSAKSVKEKRYLRLTYQPLVSTHQPSANNPQPLVTKTSAKSVKEKRILLLVCILHFVCVIPYAAFEAGYRFDPSREPMDTQTVWGLAYLFVWLLRARSILTPLTWIFGLED